MPAVLQNLIVVLGLIALIVLGYYLFTQSQSGLDTNGEVMTSQAAVESADFLRRLNEIKQIELDTSILRDGRFQSLQDNTPPVVEVPVGRANPFVEAN